mmetsp:Transcript_16421/g.21786  ORF Transcript_16421/g.21786 Transcript_16421/m.21786 type:complete len:277 (+) Transcript_16421:29-859(+)
MYNMPFMHTSQCWLIIPSSSAVRHTIKIQRHFTSPTSSSSSKKEAVSAVSGAGGFRMEHLQQWAAHHWSDNGANTNGRRRRHEIIKEEDLPYADLYSHTVTTECAKWLQYSCLDSSNELAQAFFGSKYFLPERLLLTSICKCVNNKNRLLSSSYSPSMTLETTMKTAEIVTILPNPLGLNDSFLFWKVVEKSKLELTLTWEIENVLKGCTMLSCDPKNRKVYVGSCMDQFKNSSSFFFDKKGSIFQNVVVPLHQRYSFYLLRGMVQELETKAPSIQ